MFSGLVSGRRITCSMDVMEDVFDEQELMVLHRVNLEIELADTIQEQTEQRYEAIAREIIMIEDEDDTMAEYQVAADATATDAQGGERFYSCLFTFFFLFFM